MTNTLPVIAEVEGLGKIVQARGDFYIELQKLERAGARPISPRDEAYARLMTRGKENIGRIYGTRTSAGFEYARSMLPILRLESRLLDPKLAKRAVNANKQAVWFSTDSIREYEESLRQAQEDANKEPKERNVILLPSRNGFTISDRENWEIFEAIFKDQAKPCFESNGPIKVYPILPEIKDFEDETLLAQMWFSYFDQGSVDHGSVLSADIWGLCDDGRLRGVKKTGELKCS